MVKRFICIVTGMIISLVGITFANGAFVTEIEPNNSYERANSINIGDTVRGMVNYGDGDYGDKYRLLVSQSGIMTITVSGQPSDCILCVGANGFQKYETAAIGNVEGKRGSQIALSKNIRRDVVDGI